MNPIRRLALYATAYPGALEFLADWYRSVERQTDADFELWVALDGVTADAVVEAIGRRPAANWLVAAPRDTPAQVRTRAWLALAERCDGVVLVDADDVLHPDRVATARTGLGASELAVCGLRLVDVAGRDLGRALRWPAAAPPESVLPATNVFGLSNTAYRSTLLRRCLPIPPDVEIVDWYLASRAWLTGAVIVGDTRPQMDYRQYAANATGLLPPFGADRVLHDAQRVRTHLARLVDTVADDARPDRRADLLAALAEVEAFQSRMSNDPVALSAYVAALVAAPPPPRWWAHVAAPHARALWSNSLR